MGTAKIDANRKATLIGVSKLDSETPTRVAVDPATGELLVQGTLNTGDIEIGAVEIKNSTDDTRATVGANGLYVEVRASALPSGAATETTLGLLNTNTAASKFGCNDVDDYTTTSVTYVGTEDKDGTWMIKKLDETGNFLVITYATISNNPALTTFSDAWTARTTATYNVFSTAF